ncbi:unnamed protein product, partial [Sphenostylis stenocarpa]
MVVCVLFATMEKQRLSRCQVHRVVRRGVGLSVVVAHKDLCWSLRQNVRRLVTEACLVLVVVGRLIIVDLCFVSLVDISDV